MNKMRKVWHLVPDHSDLYLTWCVSTRCKGRSCDGVESLSYSAAFRGRVYSCGVLRCAHSLVPRCVLCTCQLKPEKVYYVGGFGVLSKWLPVSEYEVSNEYALLKACRETQVGALVDLSAKETSG